MKENEALEYLKEANRKNDMLCVLPNSDIGKCLINALEEIQKYREIGTPEKVNEELDRLRNDNDCQGLYFTLEERQDLARQHRELEEYKAICTVEECREAVEKQKAKQGWIPCSERLPEEHKLYDITFKNSAGIHSDSAIYNPYLKRWLWDADETELVENEILAWAEKREPYQPKGE
ncbi:MAG: DUF551 domain-containing protein [Roseburia sp.]|nr:DUF551 domain-containing protein [Roseburia sp.]